MLPGRPNDLDMAWTKQPMVAMWEEKEFDNGEPNKPQLNWSYRS